MNSLSKKLHLLVSAIIVFAVSFVYGANPEVILPQVFDFQVSSLELKNIFRAIMGLYIAFALYWFLGVLKPKHWRSATISCILFMGGLAFGRLISTLFDGISTQYTLGMLLEFLVMFWGMYSLKKYGEVH